MGLSRISQFLKQRGEDADVRRRWITESFAGSSAQLAWAIRELFRCGVIRRSGVPGRWQAESLEEGDVVLTCFDAGYVVDGAVLVADSDTGIVS